MLPLENRASAVHWLWGKRDSICSTMRCCSVRSVRLRASSMSRYSRRAPFSSLVSARASASGVVRRLSLRSQAASATAKPLRASASSEVERARARYWHCPRLASEPAQGFVVIPHGEAIGHRGRLRQGRRAVRVGIDLAGILPLVLLMTSGPSATTGPALVTVICSGSVTALWSAVSVSTIVTG